MDCKSVRRALSLEPLKGAAVRQPFFIVCELHRKSFTQAEILLLDWAKDYL